MTTRIQLCRIILIAVLSGCFANISSGGSWKEDSFADFIDGHFPDGGSNLYVSEDGTLRIINQWDLNGDGQLDIILPSGHGHTEKEDTFIYLNNKKGDIDGRSLIRIPTNGGMDGVIRDFNKDGLNDLAICNYDNGITYQTDTYVYYGTRDGYTSDKRTVLTTVQATSLAAGDLNSDGWIDLFVANSWLEDYLDNKGDPTSFIFWNSPDGFSDQNRKPFSFGSSVVQACCIDDLDSDGKDDLILSAGGKTILYLSTRNSLNDSSAMIEIPQSGEAISTGNFNGDAWKDLALCARDAVMIFPGGPSGYSTDNRIKLPSSNARDAVFCDFDKDGLDDLAVANYSGPDGATWIHSFVYYSRGGQFDSAQKIELSTMGASGLSAGDLNGDGYSDLVVSNERVTNQACIPSLVFWNDGGTFKDNHTTMLETEGAMKNTIGDVDHDGFPDVVFFNREGEFREGASSTYVYWGDGSRNYTTTRRVEIPTHYLGGGAHADLDHDGFVDLCLIQSRFINGAREDMFGRLMILWGSPNGFTRRTNLTIDHPGSGISVVDLNRDGWLDLVAGGEVTSDPGSKNRGLPIFWGSSNGFSNHNRSVIAIPSGEGYRVPLVADLDQDGLLDFAVQYERGKVEFYKGNPTGSCEHLIHATINLGTSDFFGYINAADFNQDGNIDLLLPVRNNGKKTDTPSYVLYGQSTPFIFGGKIELPSYAGTDAAIADLNHDNWLDLVLPSYKDNFKRDVPAGIYWGSADGFSHANSTRLTSHSSAGVEIADYDQDGWQDVLLINHCKDGSTTVPGPQNHLVASFLYWGSADGFDETEKCEIPAIGPHSMNNRDPGSLSRRDPFEEYISSPYQIPDDSQVVSISWTGATPHGTSIQLQVRTAENKEQLQEAAWHGVSGVDSWFTSSPASLQGISGRWIQYRARLVTPFAASCPTLETVTIEYN